jgi:hypothetical protein
MTHRTLKPALLLLSGLTTLLLTGAALPADAQPLGTFRWQLQPFCNVLSVQVVQAGSVYTLDGYDDQCGAAQRAPLVGLATPNPDGTIGFGLHVVTVPGGAPVSIEARISVATLSGTWSDSAGNDGAFAFGAATGGGPRPTPTPGGSGDITGVTAGLGLTGGGPSGEVSLAIDPAVVQRRVSATCRAGEAVRTVNADGTVVCERINAGDITGITAGPGLTGGGTAGTVTVSTVFGGDGALDAAARADHEHVVTGTLNVGIGPSALSAAASASAGNTAVGQQAAEGLTTGGNNTAVGTAALSTTTTGSANVALGAAAGDLLTGGSGNTFIGAFANASGTLSNAAAIGQNAFVTQNNSLVLGSIAGVNGASSSTQVGIGTSAPEERLHVAGDLRVTGEVRRPSTGTSTNLVPIAYGFLLSTAEVQTATENVTVSYSNTLNCYLVDIGEVLTGATVIVSVNRGEPYVATYILASSTSFCARVYNLAGTPVAANFSFVVYRP